MPNVKTITLTGGETAVKFDANYPYFWVQNFSDSDMYMSVSPNIVPDADGVILVPAKCGRSTGDVGQTNTLYISGSGKVEITAQYNAVCPYFKYAGKGGEINGVGLEAKIVDELPETGDGKYIYLVPKSSLLSDNIYNEYLWIDGKWELIGSTEIDLTDYALKTELNSHINDKSNPHNVTAEQIKYRKVVDMYKQPISYLQNTILNWLKSAVETLSVFRFYGNNNVDFYIDNWENNSSAIDNGDRGIYTVKMLNSTSGAGGVYLFATFLITTSIPRRDGNYSADSFMVTYSAPKWYMYGRLITDKSKATTITSSSDDSTFPTSKAVYNFFEFNFYKTYPNKHFVGKTMSEFKAEILEYIQQHKQTPWIIYANGDVISKWSNNEAVIQSNVNFQITPIGGYTDLSGGYCKCLITSYAAAIPMYVFVVAAGEFSNLDRLYTYNYPPANATASSNGFLSATDKAKIDNITPEMLER